MKSPNTPASIVATTQAEIALRAYHIWQDEGRPEGRAQAHWDQAALELAQRGPREPEATFEEPPLPQTADSAADRDHPAKDDRAVRTQPQAEHRREPVGAPTVAG